MNRPCGAGVAIAALLFASCMPDQVMIQSKDDAVCGNGQQETGEQCDDGNAVDGDGCSATCQLESSPELNCADGVDNDADGLVDCADSDCAAAPGCTAICGNGVLETGEECDDGNSVDGDGCSAACVSDAGSETSCEDRADNDGDQLVDCLDPDCFTDAFCLCGNGVLEAGEACDDGNAAWCDGCDPTCQLQPTVESDCGDGVDEDCDGDVDCSDSDCFGAPGCP